jgi:hypothetical protein
MRGHRTRTRARGKTAKRPNEMNLTERAYSDILEAQRLDGKIAYWEYERVKLKLADNTFYTPDFFVILPDGQVEFHEVKAMTSKGVLLAEDDAKVKIKVAADQYWMFVFRIAARGPKSMGSKWRIEVIGNQE